MPAFVRAALAAFALLAGGEAIAQGYPQKPIRLIVPYPAGGATDFFARLVFPKVGEALGQAVVVENRPGAGTAIGASEVARSAPDGYTILLGDAGTYAFNPSLYKKLSYDPAKDFAPVSLTGRFALILAVNPSVLNAASVKEFVDAAKRAPAKIDYGAPGPGSPIHLAMELFKQRAGITMTPIPYKGGADAVQAWAELPTVGPLGEVRRVAIRSASSGVRMAAGFERLAAEIRADGAAAAAARAQRAGVHAMGPLAACFLPAFVCLGIVPVVVGVARSAVGVLP